MTWVQISVCHFKENLLLNTIKWGQSRNTDYWEWGPSYEYDTTKIYNKYCPRFYDVSDGRTIAGCTAVAMGQVMWYHRWPAYAAIPAHIYSSGVTYGGFVPRIYNWNLIPPYIRDTTALGRANTIASLLRLA